MPNTTVCPLAKKCGGCQLQNLSYPEQLHLKQATAIRLLGRFGHVEEILGMDDPYHYRNKVQAAFGVNRQGQIISGVYQSASHRIVPVSDCLIEDKVADQIIVTIRKLLKSFKIRPYDEDTGRGTLRHVLVRRGWRSGEILVVLVTAHGMLPGKRNFVRALLQQHPDITTVVQNINAGQTSLVLGAHSEVLYGPGYIREQLGDFTFRISPRAFYQINPVQTEVLYRTALEYAGLTGTETVVDAYCGTGTIGIFASRDAARVIAWRITATPCAMRSATPRPTARTMSASTPPMQATSCRAWPRPASTPTSSSSTRRAPAATSAFSPPSRP